MIEMPFIEMIIRNEMSQKTKNVDERYHETLTSKQKKILDALG